jgi:hypothetical protein
MKEPKRPVARRAIITALGTGAVVLGAASGARNASAEDARWRPELEKEDDWMELPGRHRLVFDATSADGAGDALFYTRNYIEVNESGYGIEPADLATIIILRHFATVFGYDDATWAKYGRAFSNMAKFTDPKTKEAPVRNLYDAKGYGASLPNGDVTVSDLAGRGVRFAVCGAATQKIAEAIARPRSARSSSPI